jgi:hypothetical protein
MSVAVSLLGNRLMHQSIMRQCYQYEDCILSQHSFTEIMIKKNSSALVSYDISSFGCQEVKVRRGVTDDWPP